MRPQSISVICILLFVIGFSLAIRSLGQFFILPGVYTLLTLTISMAGLYCYYGLWKMKRWSIQLFYVVWGAFTVLMFLSTSEFTTIEIIRTVYLLAVMVIFAIVVFPHRDKLEQGQVWPLNKFF